ncbi:MAG: prenyltransferase/squalene oxidase repeat-containing protein [Candidatus Kapaibacterium sp.]
MNNVNSPHSIGRNFILLSIITTCLMAQGCGGGGKPSPPLNDDELRLQRACVYLWGQQSPDGSWKSTHYAVMRSGQTLTPFILNTLLDIPERIAPRPDGAVDKALDFIKANTDNRGVLGLRDSLILEYPNYSTAYALRCLLKVNRPRDKPLIENMVKYLAGEQYNESRGFDSLSPAYGGWGFGALGLSPGDPGHMDLSHTRRCLEAIRESGYGDQPLYNRARIFLLMVQRHPLDTRPQPGALPGARSSNGYDGGFYFSPVVPDANKGKIDSSNGAEFRSYATATCDGVLSLLAAGVPANDERITAARRWLEAHPRLELPEGIPEGDPAAWDVAMHYYHLSVRSEVYARLGWPGDWRKKIIGILSREQLEDGRFENQEGVLMKEDDPLLATAHATIALNRATAKP